LKYYKSVHGIDDKINKYQLTHLNIMSFVPTLNKEYSMFDVAYIIWKQNKNKCILASSGICDGSNGSFTISDNKTLFNWILDEKKNGNITHEGYIQDAYDEQEDEEDKANIICLFYEVAGNNGSQELYLFGIDKALRKKITK
jgi:hypothetical protein